MRSYELDCFLRDIFRTVVGERLKHRGKQTGRKQRNRWICAEKEEDRKRRKYIGRKYSQDNTELRRVSERNTGKTKQRQKEERNNKLKERKLWWKEIRVRKGEETESEELGQKKIKRKKINRGRQKKKRQNRKEVKKRKKEWLQGSKKAKTVNKESRSVSTCCVVMLM